MLLLIDQDVFYDIIDALEELGMQEIIQKLLRHEPSSSSLTEQCNIYELAIKLEDGDLANSPVPGGVRMPRKSLKGPVCSFT